MAESKLDEPPSPSHNCYTALPIHQDENDVVLSYYHRDERKRRRIILAVFFLAFTSILIYIFWPSDPEIKVVRLRITRVHLHTWPVIAVDVSLLVTLKVSNPDVYFLDFRSLHVAVGYRGKMLGHVTSDHGRVRAHGSSYVDADVELRGVRVFSDVVHLLDDLANGAVPFDTVTEVNGKFGIFFVRFPLKAKLSCEVTLNTLNQTIARQSCHPG